MNCLVALQVMAVEDSIESVHRLKQDVGSYALMADSYFQHTDFLQCCKVGLGFTCAIMRCS